MTPAEHVVASEELMAYLDGELPAERAATVGGHLEKCAACQALADQLRQVSRDLDAWQVESLPPIKAPAPNWKKPRLWGSTLIAQRPILAWSALSAVIALVVVGTMWDSFARYDFAPKKKVPHQVVASQSLEWRSESQRVGGSGGSQVAVGGSTRPLQPGVPQKVVEEARPHGATPVSVAQKIIRTVELTVVASDVNKIRPEIDRILQALGGFVGQIEASDSREGERALTATLRVPVNRLDDAVRSLKALGRVVHESQSADDVTEQLVDIETRLANGRNTEKRLNEVLKNRTGDVSDVLEVEREIARVREEIERLDAERGNMERRVAYATVTLRVTEERQAALELGPVPLRLQLRNALIDGVREAASGATDLVLWALRTGPTLLLWVAVLWWPARKLLRTWRLRTATAA